MQTLDERNEAETDTHSIAITPLVFRLLIGPAEMSIMITLSNDLRGLPQKIYFNRRGCPDIARDCRRFRAGLHNDFPALSG